MNETWRVINKQEKTKYLKGPLSPRHPPKRQAGLTKSLYLHLIQVAYTGSTLKNNLSTKMFK